MQNTYKDQSEKELFEDYEKYLERVSFGINYDIVQNSIIDIFNTKYEIPITSIPKELAGADGKYSMYFPVKDGLNKNIILVSGVSEIFIKVLTDLINDKVLSFKPCSMIDYAFYGAPIYNLPIATIKSLDGNKLKWLPLLICKTN
jgi:hypothetical protein